MKFKKLGIEWGAAYEEAQPHIISHGDSKFEVFVNENHELELILPPGTMIRADKLGNIIAVVEP